MTDLPNLPPTLLHSFEHLSDVVSRMTASGPVPTAAGVKTALIKIDPSFSEKVLGFEKFLAYLESAESQGFVLVTRDGANHPRVTSTRPSSLAGDEPKPAAAMQTSVTQIAGRKLRSDVWLSAIDWSHQSRRLWDRTACRSFMFPTDSSGEPLWVTQTHRFVDVAPVTRSMQQEWMAVFAEERLDAVRDALLDALKPGAPRGSFKSALRRFHLVEAWSHRLQERVAEHLVGWANDNDIDPSRLFDRRLPVSVGPDSPQPGTNPAATAKYRVAPLSNITTASTDPALALRSRLHAVIDSMSLTELAALSIPAAYLLDN